MHTRPRWAAVTWALGVVLPLVVTAAEPPPAPPSQTHPFHPDEVVQLSLAFSPQVESAKAALLAAEGLLAQSQGLVANPQMSASWAVGGERASVGLSQALSPAGAAPAQRQAARAQIDAAQARLQRARLTTAAQARLAYAEVIVTAGRRGVAEEAVALADQLTTAVSAKLEVGEASQLDLRLSYLSQVEWATWLLDAQADEAEAVRALTALVQRPIPLGALGDDPLVVAPWEPTALEPPERSDVRAALADVRVATAARQIAARQALPPVSVGVFVQQEDGAVFAGPSVGLTLPVFQRQQQARGAAAGQVGVARVSVGSAQARAAAEAQTATARAQAAERLAGALQPDLEVEAREALKSITLGYEAGELDLPTALLLQHQVLEGESAAITLRGQVAAARIDWALSHELEALVSGGTP